MTVTLTPSELHAAAAWTKLHVENVHDGKLETGDISIRNISGSGIGVNTIVMCEACERIKGNAGNRANYHEVTDYDAW